MLKSMWLAHWRNPETTGPMMYEVNVEKGPLFLVPLRGYGWVRSFVTLHAIQVRGLAPRLAPPASGKPRRPPAGAEAIERHAARARRQPQGRDAAAHRAGPPPGPSPATRGCAGARAGTHLEPALHVPVRPARKGCHARPGVEPPAYGRDSSSAAPPRAHGGTPPATLRPAVVHE